MLTNKPEINGSLFIPGKRCDFQRQKQAEIKKDGKWAAVK
jgi:hypothetical protein